VELPVTPLERVPAGTGRPAGTLFFKREDLLPFGGGNKVRRFLHFFERRPDCIRAAALSDLGAHTFAVLASMRADPALPLSALTFYERRVPANPYRERLARTYADCADIEVRRGAGVLLWLRWCAAGLVRSSRCRRLGVGGRAPDAHGAYAPVVDECVAQLADAGTPEGPVIHVFPMASGDMAGAFLRRFDERGLADHRVVGVMTGPGFSRAWLRLRYAARARLTLRRAGALTWARYLEAAQACHAATGVWLDPVHAIHAWEVLRHAPEAFAEATVVLWVTCMHMPGAPAGASS